MELPPSQECTVRGTLAFVLRLSQIFGMASIKFERFRKSWHIRASKIACAYNIIIIAVIGVLTFMTSYLHLFKFLKITKRSYGEILSFGELFLLFLLFCTEIYFKLHRMKHIITCLSELQKINKELSRYAVPKDNEKFQRSVTIWIILTGVFAIAMRGSVVWGKILAQPNKGLLVLLQISFHFVYIMLKLLNLQISLVMACVLSSYSHLNDCLKNLLQKIRKESSEPKVFVSLPKHRHNSNIPPKSINILIDSLGTIEDREAKHENTNDEILSRLGYAYCILHDIVRQLDNSQGLFIVLLITNHFTILAVALYNFFDCIRNMTSYYEIFCRLLWFVSFIPDVVIIIEPSHQTCQQVKRTKHLICQLMLSTPLESQAFNFKLNLFYKNLLFNEVSYTPLNIFKLNRSIITVITGSLITYVVVILQL